VSDVRTNAELTEASAAGLRWISVARVACELLMLGSMVVLARLIPPSAFGVFAVAVIVQELGTTMPSEGVGTALVQRRSIDREHLQAGLAFGLLSGAAFAAVTVLLALVVVRPIFGSETETLVIVSSSWFLFGAVAAAPTAVMRRRLDFRKLSLLDLTNTFVRTVTSLLLATVAGLDAPALVLGALAGVAAMSLLALAFAPVPLPRWRTAALRDLLPYSGPASLACVCWAGFRNGDYAIVGARLGTTQAGVYWRGFQLAVEYQRKISLVMTSVAFPVLARTAGADEMFALRRRMVRMLTITVFPLLAGLVLLAPVAVPWIFGPAWEAAVLPTQILAGAGAATVVIDAVGTVLMASGRARAMLGYGVAHFLVYVLAVLFASNWGVTGVCVAAVSVHMVFVVVAYELLLRGREESAFGLLWADVSAATGGCVGLVAAALPVELALSASGVPAIVHMAIVGTVAACAYLAALRACSAEGWRDLSVLARRVLPARPLRAVARLAPQVAGRSS
jgi:O-antigen/teichoic acid export membrane protein